MAKKKKKIDCRPTYEISRAGHLLATKGHSKAGKVLSTEGKREKAKRLKKGCLNGPPGTFKLTDKQKRKLSPGLQKAILAYQRKKGKRIID
jgi:hypothetical protein